MEILIAAFSAWIAAQTALTPPPPPRVIQIDPAAMQELASGDDVQLAYRVRALYGRQGQTVYLRKNWDPEQLSDRSELVHELVHISRRFTACPMAAMPNVKSLPMSCRSSGCGSRAWTIPIPFFRSTTSSS